MEDSEKLNIILKSCFSLIWPLCHIWKGRYCPWQLTSNFYYESKGICSGKIGFKILKTVSRDKVSFTPQFHVKEIDEFVHKATSSFKNEFFQCKTKFYAIKYSFILFSSSLFDKTCCFVCCQHLKTKKVKFTFLFLAHLQEV